MISPLQLLKIPVTKTLWQNMSALDPFKSDRYQSSYFPGDCSSYLLVELHESLTMIITFKQLLRNSLLEVNLHLFFLSKHKYEESIFFPMVAKTTLDAATLFQSIIWLRNFF